MKSLMTILCMFVMTWCCHAQSADTIRFVYASSKEDSALYTFTSSSHLIRFQKGKKILKKHLDIPMIVDGHSRYHVRMMGNQPVGLLEADRRLATFYADSIFTSEGKYKIVEYSHLKWSYRLNGSEVLVCRYFSEKSIKNLVLEFTGNPADKHLLMLLAVDQARRMIKNQRYHWRQGKNSSPPHFFDRPHFHLEPKPPNIR